MLVTTREIRHRCARRWPDFVSALDADISGLRIAWSPDYGYAGVDAEVVEVSASAARVFEGLGCTVEDSNLALESPFETWWVFFCANVFVTQGHLLDDPSDPLTWYGRMAIEDGKEYSAGDFIKAMGARDRMMNQFADVFEDYDLLLSPTMATTAFPVQEYPHVIGGKANANRKGWSFVPFTHPIKLSGIPPQACHAVSHRTACLSAYTSWGVRAMRRRS